MVARFRSTSNASPFSVEKREVSAMTRIVSFALLTAMLLIGHAAWAGGGPIQVAKNVPYEDSDRVDTKIVQECEQLGTKLGRYLNEYATQYGVETTLVDKVDPKAAGRVLVVEITSAVSGGNAFIGHSKSMSAQAELFENGVSQGTENFSRASGGGFMGAYKGSCSVLGRCSKALGKDIAEWLRDRKK